MNTNYKLKIYFDADDVLLQSTSTVLEILNKKYNNLNASLEDVLNWNYTDICPWLTEKEVLDIYESPEFWDNVQINPSAIELVKNMSRKAELVIVSKGTKENLRSKEIFFQNMLPECRFIGLRFGSSGQNFSKSCVDMGGDNCLSIQIDDRTDCLNGTNATLKILLKNGMEKPWNKYCGGEPNLYVANNWDDVKAIIEFYEANRDLLAEVACNA